MKVVSFQQSYSSRMFHKLMPLLWGVSGLFMLGIISFVLPTYIQALRQFSLVFLLFGFAVLIICINLFKPLIDEMRDYRFGEEGEKEVLHLLKDTLDDSYTYLENYVIPNTRIGDIDGLLIGPKGVIIIEVKNYVGVFRVSGGDMLRRLRGDIYKLYRKSPFKQAIRQKTFLEKYLREKGVEVRVRPIVALVEGKISAIVGETKVFITESKNLTNTIFKLSPASEWSPELESKIWSALDTTVPLPDTETIKLHS